MTGDRARIAAALAGFGLVLGIVVTVVLQGEAPALQSGDRGRVIRPGKLRTRGFPTRNKSGGGFRSYRFLSPRVILRDSSSRPRAPRFTPPVLHARARPSKVAPRHARLALQSPIANSMP